MKKNTKGSTLQAAPKTEASGSGVEMSVDLFRGIVKQTDAVETHLTNETYTAKKDTKTHKKGEVLRYGRDIKRLLPVSKIMEQQKVSKAVATTKQQDAGKAMLKEASHYITEAMGDKAVICNRITHSSLDCNINLHKVVVQDEAMKLHVSTGRPLEECKAFIAGQAVKAAN